MRIFILEDDLVRIGLFREALNGQHDLTVVKELAGDNGAFLNWEPPYDVVFLDHDLGGHQMVDSDQEETGFRFVQSMGVCPENMSRAPVIVHSYNPEGAQKMVDHLVTNGWHVDKIPFGTTVLRACRGWSIAQTT